MAASSTPSQTSTTVCAHAPLDVTLCSLPRRSAPAPGIASAGPGVTRHFGFVNVGGSRSTAAESPHAVKHDSSADTPAQRGPYGGWGLTSSWPSRLACGGGRRDRRDSAESANDAAG